MPKKRQVNKKNQSTKSKRNLRRIGLSLVFLGILYAVLWVATPSYEEYYGDTASSLNIAGLETPMLREGDSLVLHTGFALVYNEKHEQPDWVAYELTRDEVYGIHDRADNFRADPSINTDSASLADYRGSGYDRGHLIPAADLKWSLEAMSDSFYMSNMSPQEPDFNRGIWSKLEAVIRNMAVKEGSIHVVTGPVLTDGPYPTIGDNEVSVPNQYYKVVLDYVEPELKAIGFLLPNEGSQQPLAEFATSIAHIEQVTGLDFFPQLPDDIEAELESSVNVSLWDFSEFRASASEREQYQSGAFQPVSTTPNLPLEPQSSSLKDTILHTMIRLKHEMEIFFISLLEPLIAW
jgi:endonuclease G, mitochondrial